MRYIKYIVAVLLGALLTKLYYPTKITTVETVLVPHEVKKEIEPELTVEKLWTTVNQYRKDNGLNPLRLNEKLQLSSKLKCEDMVARNYWSHDTPDGQKEWTFFNQANFNYIKAGENLTYGFSSDKDVLIAWKNSQEHNENLLDKNYTDVGYAICDSDNFIDKGHKVIVVQHLAK